jgi:peptidoglycan/LPS O-acetylase OafA/YrhL
MGYCWKICKPDSIFKIIKLLPCYLQSEIKIQPGKHIPQLDGLRGIAILMVICYHFFPNNIVCNFGWSGVDLFFVLSGFLITGRLMPYLDDKKILLKFYRNRFLRIVPLYFGFLTLFFGAWFLLSSKETLGSFTFYSDHWWQFFLFIQNWVFANNLIEAKTHVQHLWSIAVEEQIYLLFPLALIFISNKTKIFYFVLFTIVAILISRWYYFTLAIPREGYPRIFYNTFFRFDSFLSGVLVYLIYNNQIQFKKVKTILQWSGLICFLVLFIYIFITKDAEKNNTFISGGGYTIIAIMYAGLLQVTLFKKNKIVNLITSSGFLRYTGRISYGMYIFHWPLFLVGFAVINKAFAYLHFIPGSTTIHIINVLICFPATYLISHLSFRYFESFFLKRKVRSA